MPVLDEAGFTALLDGGPEAVAPAADPADGAAEGSDAGA